MLDKNGIAKRIAQEIREGYYVNLGIGIPTLVANYIPDGMNADLVLSVAIHHIEDPRDTMKARFEALRPGGRCLLWLYGREGNEFYLGLKSAPPNRAKINPQPCRSFGQISQLSMRQAVRVMARRDSEMPGSSPKCRRS